jgi:hypothetical protein
MKNKRIDIVIPTAINVILMVNENIIDNLRLQQASNLEQLSLYKQAYLVVNVTDELAVARQNFTGTDS